MEYGDKPTQLFCGGCGSPVREDDKFCGSCGKPKEVNPREVPSDQEPGIHHWSTHRPCPSCNEAMERVVARCPSCGKTSTPWLFRDGFWWTTDPEGAQYWLDEKLNEWKKGQSRALPAPTVGSLIARFKGLVLYERGIVIPPYGMVPLTGARAEIDNPVLESVSRPTLTRLALLGPFAALVPKEGLEKGGGHLTIITPMAQGVIQFKHGYETYAREFAARVNSLASSLQQDTLAQVKVTEPSPAHQEVPTTMAAGAVHIDLQRTALLAQEVSDATNDGWIVEKQSAPFTTRLSRDKRPRHWLHLILTIMTLGLWSPVWVVRSISSRYRWQTILIGPRLQPHRVGPKRLVLPILVSSSLAALVVLSGLASLGSNTSSSRAPDPDKTETTQTTVSNEPAPPAHREEPSYYTTQSATIQGHNIHVGMTSDEVFGLLGKSGKEPTVTEGRLGMRVIHHYNFSEAFYDLAFERTRNPGPYALVEITVYP